MSDDHVHQYAEDVQREAYNERAIVLAWLGRPEVAERLARWFDGASLLAALRQLAEEGK